MNSLRTTSAAMAGLAVVLFIAVQFAPWGGFETDGGSAFGFSFPGARVDAYTWEVKSSSGGSSEQHSWYDSDADDSDGIGRIRAAIPLLLAGLILGFVGTLVTLGVRGGLGPILTMVAAIAATVGIILFTTGVDSAFDGTGFDWAVSFYLAIAAGALLVISGVLGLMSGNRLAGVA